MTRDEWKAFHRRIREVLPGLQSNRALNAGLFRDRDGGYCRYHENGHLDAKTSHARVLRHATNSRFQPDHGVYMERAKLLRLHGTWL